MNVSEFLEARIAEEEAVARQVADGPGDPGGDGIWAVFIGVSGNDAKFAHVAADPGRVLAECEAKRALLALHAGGEYRGQMTCNSCGDWWDGSPEDYPCENLKILAAVYKDHPDYQQEWATDAV